MVEWIIISCLILVLIFLVVYYFITQFRNHSDYQYLLDKHTELENLYNIINDNYSDLLAKYSCSLDTHEKMHDEMWKRCKLLELELEKKDLEIDKLKTALIYAKEANNEEEKVEKDVEEAQEGEQEGS